jgi:hypothetical protein
MPSLPVPSIFGTRGGALKLTNPGFNIFDLDCLCGLG